MLKRMLVLAVSLVLAACAATPTASLPTINQVEYRIGGGDTLRLTVFREEALSGEFQVNEAGMINLPLVGDIQASGKTIPEFRADLTELLGREFVRDPNVTVAVANYRPVYILGEVTNPGQYDYAENMTVFALVARAGGFTYRADQSQVMIRHENEAEERAYSLSSGGAILPGDTVRFTARYF
jgi:protein involved in polysaccharide export with SLBB domain